MLTDRVYRLLTAAVDGELGARDQRAVEQLLRESTEARDFYSRLKHDSDGLKNLPRVNAPEELEAQVMPALSSPNRPSPGSRETGKRRWPAWLNLAAAAAVLVAISLGTYAVMVLTESPREVAQRNPSPPIHVPAPRITDAPAIAHNTPVNEPRQPETLPIPRDEVVDAGKPDVAEPGSRDVLTANVKPVFDKLFTVELPAVSAIVAVRDLDQNGTRQKLSDVLKKNDGVHLDLFCKDTNRAFERLQATFKNQRLLIDAVAQERLQRKLKTHYVFYSESLTADEIQAIMQTLAADERRAEAKKEPQFDKLVANPLSPNSVKTLSMLLGVDPKWLQQKKSGALLDPTKPLSDSTADSLAKSLKSGPATARTERLVLVLPYNPIRPNPLASKEVRQFLDNVQKDRRPGTIPLLLVLRSAEN